MATTEAGHAADRCYTDQDGHFHLNGSNFYLNESGDIFSATEIAYMDGLTPGTVTASKGVVVDSNKDISAFRNVTLTNLDAGASGTAGTVDIFPTTASKGKLAITCADQTGDTTVTVTTAAMAAARTLTIPDPGAAASFVMTAGTQTLAGAYSFTTSNVTITDVNVVLSATTGTKIGTATTQKLGFWNATPIVQPSGAGQAALNAYGAGANGFDSGANASALHALVVAMRLALVDAGIIKGAA